MTRPSNDPKDDLPLKADPQSTEIGRFRSIVMGILAYPKKLDPDEIVKLLPGDNRFTLTLKTLFDKDDT